jgi:hypothetical protein
VRPWTMPRTIASRIDMSFQGNAKGGGCGRAILIQKTPLSEAGV